MMVVLCWPCVTVGVSGWGEGGERGRIIYSGCCCGRNIFRKIYMFVILFMILIKYCHTRSININNKPECFSERLVLVLLYLSFLLFLYLCLVITGPYQGVFFSCCFLQIKPCI